MAESTEEYRKMLSSILLDDIHIEDEDPEISKRIRPENVWDGGAKQLKEIIGDIY